MPPSRPLVSCLTVTENRFDMLKRAIRCFDDQTWPEKELVVVSQGSDEYKRRIADHLRGRSDVRLVFVPPGHTLGALRNLSLDAMRGDLLAVWDDDDLSHPERLAVQVEALQATGARACFLREQLQWFADDGLVFWSDKRGPCMNTAVAFRDPTVRYPERGPYASIGEDIAFVGLLLQRGRHAVLPGRAELYVYTAHASNTWGQLERVHATCDRAVPVTQWAREPAEALGTLERHGISARPAGPQAARVLWERESSRADPLRLRRFRAVLATRAGQADEARRELTAGPMDEPRAWFEFGGLCFRTGRIGDAEHALRQALSIEPTFPEAWAGLGDVLVHLERYAEAERACREGLALGAMDAVCVAGLGRSLAMQGRRREAVGHLREAVLRAPSTDRWHRLLIEGMREAGLASGLGSTYDNLCALRPFASRVHTWRGIVAAAAGRRDEALASWRRAAELDPQDPEPHRRSAELRAPLPR